jgi:hypothetical protein
MIAARSTLDGFEPWTTNERLLLAAAIGPPAEARAAYATWRATVDLDTLHGSALRVLPLLADRAVSTDDDLVTKQVMKVVRFSWLKSQMLLTHALTAIENLTLNGIPVMLVKGAAVVVHTHEQLYLRPMDDLDIAVARHQAADAAFVLTAIGMTASSLSGDPTDTAIFDQVHALPFIGASHAILDLHWQIIHGSLHRGASSEFWDRAVPTTLRDVPVLALSPADTLVQVVAHGQRLNDQRPLQWATDAALLLRDRPDFDWELVASVAQRHRVANVVGRALKRLETVAPDLFPATLPRALRGDRRQPRPASIASHWDEFARRTIHPGERATPGHGIDFLKETWAVDRLRELPSLAAWWASGRRLSRITSVPVTTSIDPLGPGEELHFQSTGPGPGLLGSGWWAPDYHGSWSRGREATLAVPLAGSAGPVAELAVSAVPFLSPDDPYLAVRVYRDGRLVARWGYSGGGREETRHLRVTVAPAGELITLRLVFSRRISATDAGLLADNRPMAFALRSIAVADISHPPHGWRSVSESPS